MDLIVFSIIAAISEFLPFFLLKKLDSAIFVSLGTMIFIISSIRWGRVSVVVLIVSSLPLFFVTEANIKESILYYGVANLFAAIPIMIYGNRDRDMLRNPFWRYCVYILSVFACLSIGKGIVLLILSDFEIGFTTYISSIALTVMIDCLFLFLLNSRKIELIMDMDNYLERVSEGDTDE